MPVCLCARLCRDQLLRTFDIRYSEWSLVQVFQKFFNVFNDLGPYAIYFSGSTLIFCFGANHLPTKRRVGKVVPNFDEELKVFKYISPLCEITSKKRFNIVQHLKRCSKIVDRKKQVKKNRTCRYCGASFVRKSNCDRHIQKQHPNENETPHQDGNDDLIIDDFEMIPTQTIDLDPMMELRVENSVETEGDFEEPEEQIDQLAEDRNDDDIIDENTQETVEADSLNQKNLGDVIVELDNLYQKRQAQFQGTFLTKILRKVTADLKDNQKRNEALGFLVHVAGHNLNDKRFIQFLSENVGYKYKSHHLANILSSYKAQKKMET